MEKRCHEIHVEIAAIGSGELSTELQEHVKECESCSRLRADAVALATAVSPENSREISAAAAVSMARRATANKERPRFTLLIAPLISASVTAAALILYFGIVTPTALGDSSEQTEVLSESSQPGTVLALTPSIPASSETTVPDSLLALRSLLLVTEEGGGGEL